MPYVTKKSGDGQFCVFKKGDRSPIPGGSHKTKKDADKHCDALNINVTSMARVNEQRTQGALYSSLELCAVEDMVEAGYRLGVTAGSAIAALQAAAPQLTTIRDQQILKTGIEYPLSTGPTTFTPEDLTQAVAAQDDPAVVSPRVWIGHPDDLRIHGERGGGIPSGEPALGRVRNMRLTDEGHTIVGDLEGIPLWLARILGSAFPSRSIEAAFNVETVTGHKWNLVINGLALLGVVWPGVSTLEDVASLYTEDGPSEVEVIEANKEQPVTITAAAERTVAGQITVEDLRRQFYESLNDDQAWWWIRAIYLDPNELIVDDDDGGLHRVPFGIDDDDVSFDDPKEVKVKYVNASNGGVTSETINANREHVALFASRAEARPEAGTASTDKEPEDVIEFKLTDEWRDRSGLIKINLGGTR